MNNPGSNYRSAVTHIPKGYVLPIIEQPVLIRQLNRSSEINLTDKPVLNTFTPDGYIPCPSNHSIRVFPPYIKWARMILNVKAVNTPKEGGAGYEDIMDNLLDQAHELLISNAKRS